MILAQTTAAAENHGVPWAVIVPWVLSAVGATAVVLVAAFKAIWSWAKEKDKKLAEANELRATTAEHRADRAEEREAEAQNHYSRLKGEFKATTAALRIARRQEEAVEVGHPISIPPPPIEEEHTGRFFVDSAADRAWFEAREREREYRKLNPETSNGLDSRTREELEKYVNDADSSIPPQRFPAPRPGPKKR